MSQACTFRSDKIPVRCAVVRLCEQAGQAQVKVKGIWLDMAIGGKANGSRSSHYR